MNIMVEAQYVPGEQNTHADFLSRRRRDKNDWKLRTPWFQLAMKHFNLTPNLDCFATFENRQCNDYISWGKDPYAVSRDFFLTDPNFLRRKRLYANPPWPIILKTLSFLRAHSLEMMIVVPY